MGPPAVASSLGRVEAGWPAAAELAIDAGGTSGMYLAALQAGYGEVGYVPFVVRRPPKPTPQSGPPCWW